jgi:hypothetical protein
MKRFFPTSLTLLLVMGSLGHVFAAAFCPRSLGRECCFRNTSNHRHDSSSAHEDMVMDGLPMDHMTMPGMHDMSTMDGMVMSETSTDDTSGPSSSGNYARTLDDALEQPVESCPHCMSHSGFPNAPVSSVKAHDESRKAVNTEPLPASSFLALPVTTVASNGLPREHAPPGPSAPRHILNNVLLI